MGCYLLVHADFKLHYNSRILKIMRSQLCLMNVEYSTLSRKRIGKKTTTTKWEKQPIRRFPLCLWGIWSAFWLVHCFSSPKYLLLSFWLCRISYIFYADEKLVPSLLAQFLLLSHNVQNIKISQGKYANPAWNLGIML